MKICKKNNFDETLYFSENFILFFVSFTIFYLFNDLFKEIIETIYKKYIGPDIFFIRYIYYFSEPSSMGNEQLRNCKF